MLDEIREEPRPRSKELGKKAEAAFCRWLEGYLGEQACNRCGAPHDWSGKDWQGPMGGTRRHRCRDGGTGDAELMLKEEATELRLKPLCASE